MRKLIYSMTVSLDGFIAGQDGAIDWSVPDEELFGFHTQQVQETGMHLCGRRLYETMAYWETAEESPLAAEQVEFAHIWKALPKVVFSTTLESVVGNTRLAMDGVGEEVSRLKQQPGKDIAVGGAGLARACMKLELIDEWAAVRQPGPTRRRHALLPDLGQKDQPRVGRDEDVWLSRRLPSIQARARRPVGATPGCPRRTRRRRRDTMADRMADREPSYSSSSSSLSASSTDRAMTDEIGAEIGSSERRPTNEKGTATMKLTTTTQVSVDGVMQGNGGRDEDRDPGFERGGWAMGLFDNEAMALSTRSTSAPTHSCSAGGPTRSSPATGE